MVNYSKGDKVKWKSDGSEAIGEVEKELTSETEAAGRKVKASKDRPQYLVKSDKSGGEAVHKPEALENPDRREPKGGRTCRTAPRKLHAPVRKSGRCLNCPEMRTESSDAHGRYRIYTPESLGTAVRHYRKEAGLSQEALAALTGLNRTYLSGLESGKETEQVRRLLKVLHELGVRMTLEQADW